MPQPPPRPGRVEVHPVTQARAEGPAHDGGLSRRALRSPWRSPAPLNRPHGGRADDGRDPLTGADEEAPDLLNRRTRTRLERDGAYHAAIGMRDVTEALRPAVEPLTEPELAPNPPLPIDFAPDSG